MSRLTKQKLFLILLIHIFVLLIIIFPAKTYSQFYNGSQLSFGQNRVQYTNFFWTFYMFDDFDTYFYRNGKELAIFTSKYAQSYIPELEQKLESNLEDKIQFIIYNNLSDLKQSNIGLISDEHYNTGGVTHIIGNKVFLYFDGDHSNFEKQIRAGIAHVIIKQMMYGGTIGSQIKNTSLFVLPDWYINGLISFFSEEWNTDIDNRVKDGILSGDYKKFNHLTGTDAIYAGHSLWKYISDKYGKSSVPDIIHMTNISNSIENGFLYVIGVSFKNLITEWLTYYREIYSSPNNRYLPENPLLKKSKKNTVYSQLKTSPDRKYATYTTNQLGQYKIWIYNFETQKSKRIFKSGFKLDEKTDYSYPLLAWHPTGQLLAFIVERKGHIFLYFYTLENRKFDKRVLVNFEKILDFSYSNNGKYFVLSAVQKGQSDIYVFNIAAGSHEQITNDIYDDLQPRFINNSKKIIFSSNRINDTIRFEKNKIPINLPKNHDLFLYNYATRNNVLRRITNTPLANEIQAMEYQENYISYLSDENGIYNQYIARFDSTISYVDTIVHHRYFTQSFPVTNYSRNIIEQNINPNAKKYSQIIYSDEVYKLYVKDLLLAKHLQAAELQNTAYMSQLVQIYKKEIKKIKEPEKQKRKRRKRFSTVREGETEKTGENNININNYEFEKQSFFKIEGKEILKTSDTNYTFDDETYEKFIIPKRRNYNVEYSINELVTQIDFTFLNTTYQAFTGGVYPIYLNPGLNALFKIGITDLMEDYRITGGVRLNINFINNEYLLSYNNLKRRLDKEIIFHRRTEEYVGYYSIIRVHSHEIYYILKWPFNQAMCIKGTASFRNDLSVYLSTDQYNLRVPNNIKNWIGLKGEFIYDDTRKFGLNLYYGTRYKIFGEYFQLLNEESSNLVVLGLDFRHYQKIHRTFIWANRFAASTSFGKNKLIYYMGGVDNWLFPKFDQLTPIDFSQNYAYQTLATNMRGFNQNIRNGNNFIVINSELRFPVFRYFFNRPIKSDFLNNFQIIGFGDIGTAWTGLNPYSIENSLYTRIIQNGPLKITIELQKDPIVGGFGFGVRSRLLGYFIRADWAWGVEDGIIKPSIFYLSLSLDF